MELTSAEWYVMNALWQDWPATAQVFACPPQEGSVAYLLASAEPVLSGYVDLEYEEFLKEHRGEPCRFHWDSHSCERTFHNMVAEIEGGRFPNEAVVLGAHIDTWPGLAGASDNASGTAMLVELARWFVEHPPQQTLRFVWFTGEELYRRGSAAYVRMHADEASSLRLFVNLDSGVTAEHGPPRAAVSGGADQLAGVARLVRDAGLDYAVYEDTHGACDTVPFKEAGIPTAFVCAHYKESGGHPHLPTERYDVVDPGQARKMGDLALLIADTALKGRLLSMSGGSDRS